MIERVKTFAIIALLGLSSVIWASYSSDRKMFHEFMEIFEQQAVHQEKYQFDIAQSLLQKLESKDTVEAQYLLYVTSKTMAGSLGAEKVPQALSKKLESFNSSYRNFMKSQCERSNFEACLQLGYVHKESEEYDLAYEAYRKSADAGNFPAMSALVDLYRISSWSGSSEEKAKEWLYKVGK